MQRLDRRGLETASLRHCPFHHPKELPFLFAHGLRPPALGIEWLEGDYGEGQFSISVNDQWRICSRFLDGDAYDVELTGYH